MALDEIRKVDLTRSVEMGVRFEEHNGIACYLTTRHSPQKSELEGATGRTLWPPSSASLILMNVLDVSEEHGPSPTISDMSALVVPFVSPGLPCKAAIYTYGFRCRSSLLDTSVGQEGSVSLRSMRA